MVTHPRDYPWSSYRIDAEGKTRELITTHRLYQRLGLDDAQRKAAYKSLFKTDLDTDLIQKITDTTNGGIVLGSQRFIDQVEQQLGCRAQLGKVGRPQKNAD
jgi:putative transposase